MTICLKCLFESETLLTLCKIFFSTVGRIWYQTSDNCASLIFSMESKWSTFVKWRCQVLFSTAVHFILFIYHFKKMLFWHFCSLVETMTWIKLLNFYDWDMEFQNAGLAPSEENSFSKSRYVRKSINIGFSEISIVFLHGMQNSKYESWSAVLNLLG